MIVTGGASELSDSLNCRPRSSEISIASKYPGETCRNSSSGLGFLSSEVRPSMLKEESLFVPLIGRMLVKPAFLIRDSGDSFLRFVIKTRLACVVGIGQRR